MFIIARDYKVSDPGYLAGSILHIYTEQYFHAGTSSGAVCTDFQFNLRFWCNYVVWTSATFASESSFKKAGKSAHAVDRVSTDVGLMHL